LGKKELWIGKGEGKRGIGRTINSNWDPETKVPLDAWVTWSGGEGNMTWG